MTKNTEQHVQWGGRNELRKREQIAEIWENKKQEPEPRLKGKTAPAGRLPPLLCHFSFDGALSQGPGVTHIWKQMWTCLAKHKFIGRHRTSARAPLREVWMWIWSVLKLKAHIRPAHHPGMCRCPSVPEGLRHRCQWICTRHLIQEYEEFMGSCGISKHSWKFVQDGSHCEATFTPLSATSVQAATFNEKSL